MDVNNRPCRILILSEARLMRGALQNLDEDAQADLIRQKEISSPKPGRQPVNK